MANSLNLDIDQGSSKSFTFTLVNTDDTPFEMSGYDARLQIRRTFGDTAALVNCTIPNGKLTLSGNVVTLNLGPSDTTSIRFNNKDDDTLEAVYDLEIISPAGKVFKPARGTFTLNREVTR